MRFSNSPKGKLFWKVFAKDFSLKDSLRGMRFHGGHGIPDYETKQLAERLQFKSRRQLWNVINTEGKTIPPVPRERFSYFCLDLIRSLVLYNTLLEATFITGVYALIRGAPFINQPEEIFSVSSNTRKTCCCPLKKGNNVISIIFQSLFFRDVIVKCNSDKTNELCETYIEDYNLKSLNGRRKENGGSWEIWRFWILKNLDLFSAISYFKSTVFYNTILPRVHGYIHNKWYNKYSTSNI